MNKLKRYWSRIAATPYAIAMGALPGLENRITQIRPKNNGGENEFNVTLNAIWERLFGSNGGAANVFILIALLASIVLVNAGIRYISSGGKPERVTQARTMILHTILAIVILVASYTILRVIIALAVFLAGNR